MICHNGYVTKDAAEYLNGHPAFTDCRGCVMNPDFFYKCVHPELQSGNPVFDRYCDGVWGRKKFDLDDAKAFLAWLDPKWTEYRHLDRSEFFKESDLRLTNDGIEFMDI